MLNIYGFCCLHFDCLTLKFCSYCTVYVYIAVFCSAQIAISAPITVWYCCKDKGIFRDFWAT